MNSFEEADSIRRPGSRIWSRRSLVSARTVAETGYRESALISPKISPAARTVRPPGAISAGKAERMTVDEVPAPRPTMVCVPGRAPGRWAVGTWAPPRTFGREPVSPATAFSRTTSADPSTM